jgi:MbtH protein
MTRQIAPEAAGQSQDRVESVVINDEGQYSIWPSQKTPPFGWHRISVEGSAADCLAHIDAVWTDMRPVSVRAGGKSPATPPETR